MNPLAGSGVFCAKAGETASRALRPSAAAIAVETTKSRRDRLSMGHLLEANSQARPARRAPTRPRLARCAVYSRLKSLGSGSRSHRLERAIDLDVDEHRTAVLQRMRDEIGGLMHGLGTLRHNAERTREGHKIDLGIEKLHADIAVGLLGEAAHGMQALLEDAIRAVVEDHEDRANAIMRGGPEPNHRPIGQGELHADRGGQ